MNNYSEHFEEKASEYISQRNRLVKSGMNPNNKFINNIEERAANWLSRAKHGLPNE